MSLQLIHLLSQWHHLKDQTQWVLGTIYKTKGPCYRKTGAMMLFGGDGQQLGMLSGGCLESDIQQHARKVMQMGHTITLSYDGNDEDDLSFQLGIGCGGTIHILLQLVNGDNHYQQLDLLLGALKARRSGQYQVLLPQQSQSNPDLQSHCNQFTVAAKPMTQATLIHQLNHNWLNIPVEPQPHILVIGGGVDARPLVAMASQMGWMVSLWDPRPANARRDYFLTASHILEGTAHDLNVFCRDQRVNGAVLMSHNLSIDADALKALVTDKPDSLAYLALLGPINRRKQVLAKAQLSELDIASLAIASPAGLNIGGELPESIALSILAQCHACLFLGPKLNQG